MNLSRTSEHVRLLSFVIAALVAGPVQAGDVSFARDIAPVLKRSCAICHLTGDEPGSMALHPKGAYKALVGVKSEESALLRVAPGNPEGSYLFLKITGRHLEAGGMGETMPLGANPLTDADIAAIRQWIAAGAKNN